MSEAHLLRHRRILVVDDNPSIHEDIRKILRGRSAQQASVASDAAFLFDEQLSELGQTEFEIDSAFQGQEALARVEQAQAAGRPYALAFVDVRMPPGWDGVETIKRIWAVQPDLQVVICTAYADYSWEEMMQRIGRSDSLLILKKPFDSVEVLQLAHALTEKWLLNQQVKEQLQALNRLVGERTAELQAANHQLQATNDRLQREIAERREAEQALRQSQKREAVGPSPSFTEL